LSKFFLDIFIYPVVMRRAVGSIRMKFAPGGAME
jgi:hypothetical protein